jgi:outer membrane lipoprotein SlyB
MKASSGLIGISLISGSQIIVRWLFLVLFSTLNFALDTIQRAVALNPEAVSAAHGSAAHGSAGNTVGGGADQETAMLLASLREVISNQAQEMQVLKKRIQELSTEKNEEVWTLAVCVF